MHNVNIFCLRVLRTLKDFVVKPQFFFFTSVLSIVL